MKSRNYLIGLFSLTALNFILGSCESLDDEPGALQDIHVQQGDKVQVTFQAVAPATGTEDSRTTLVDGKSVYWSSGDAIALFTDFASEKTDSYRFTSDIPEGKCVNTAFFTGFVDEGYEGPYTAFYPFELFKGYGWYNDEEYGICFTVPFLQTAIADNFAPRLNPTWAQTNIYGGVLNFQNIGALVKFTMTDVVPGLESIVLSDDVGKKISGEMVLGLKNPNVPVLSEYIDGTSSGCIKMEGVFEDGQNYYFVVAPTEGVFSEGFSLTFNKSDGTCFVKKGKAGVITDLQSSQIVDLGNISLKNAMFAETITDLNFIAAVDRATGIDWTKNEDGTVPITEGNVAKMKAIQSLDISDAGIQSLYGIRYFTGLVDLKCNGNQLIELDVTGLKNLKALDCTGNAICRLEISGLSSLEELLCQKNKLSSLDVSESLNLNTLYCFSNDLSDLKLGALSRLRILNCCDNHLTSLDVSALDNLYEFNCSVNELSVLDVNRLVNLEFLFCDKNKLSELDVTNLSQLRRFTCSDNQISTLEVSTLTNLTDLVCASNRLKRLDVKNLKKMEGFNCSYNEITELDVTGLTALRKFYCWNNQIQTLDISGATGLVDVECYNNLIKELDLDNLTDLEALNCAQNQISALDLFRQTKLRSLFCGGNFLVELDLSVQRGLTQLSCITQRTVTEENKLSLILNETMRDWWNGQSDRNQNKCNVTWVE